MHFVSAKGILSAQNGMNIYRGCTHGCIYCDSRSACYQMPHAFEDVEVKQNAPELLDLALARKRRPCMVGTGGMSDPYMPCEAELALTRRCLEIIARHGCGAAVQTKSDLVLRDMDLFVRIRDRAKCVVQMTLTTADDALCRVVEPNVCPTGRRYEALKVLQREGIPTVVWMTPLLPYINDTEENVRAILDLCFDAGVRGVLTFGCGLTLRQGDREYYYAALDRHFPELKEVYIKNYGNAYELPSPRAARLRELIVTACRAHHVMTDTDEIFAWLRHLPDPYPQMRLPL